MLLVLITAFCIALAALLGALLGMVFGEIPKRINDLIMSFASGIMLCAAVCGLVLPAVEFAKRGGAAIACLGILAGAAFIYAINRLLPFIFKKSREESSQLSKTLLFVAAIAIHHFPEGMAVGVSFCTENTASIVSVAGCIAAQNIPEGMVIVSPLLACAVSRKRTWLAALLSGLVGAVGVLFGFLAVSIASAVMPFALAFAGGTMLYVLCSSMIPDTCAQGKASTAFLLLSGFCTMLFFQTLIDNLQG